MTIQKIAEAKLPTHWGDFSVIAYEDEVKDEEHLLLYMGDLTNDSLLRIHSQCLTGDTLYSLKCCLLYTSPSPRDLSTSRMPSSA